MTTKFNELRQSLVPGDLVEIYYSDTGMWIESVRGKKILGIFLSSSDYLLLFIGFHNNKYKTDWTIGHSSIDMNCLFVTKL